MVTKNKFSTRCVHEGEIKDTMYQGIVSPLFMSTTYPWFGGDAESKPYPRYFNTPNQEFLSKKIASLENGEKALIFTSGMAAISTSIMANVKMGDHIIFQNDLYGGTRNFIQTEFDKFGIEYSFTNSLDPKSFSDEIEYVHDRPAHDFRYSVDISKFNKIGKKLKFNTFKYNLEQTVKWYIFNKKWVKKTLLRSGYVGDRLGTSW